MKLVVFLGPSLPRAEAKRLVRASFRPPARQGDVFRAIEERPRAIALIDGVFESQPSVWHHELVAAQAAGIRVFGAASMGALRAAELPDVVEPIGVIARAYLEGTWVDDAHVALLHADETHGFRAMTLPHVNVWATVELAKRRKVLSGVRARQLLAESERQFYQSRTWATLLEALPWPRPLTDRFARFVASHAVDQKAADARECLRAAGRFVAQRTVRSGLISQGFSSFVRRVRLHESGIRDEALADRGGATLLLAEFARVAGVEADPEEVERYWRRLPERGWGDDERWRAAQSLVLERMVLDGAEYFVSDGPSRSEGYRLEQMRRAASRRRR